MGVGSPRFQIKRDRMCSLRIRSRFYSMTLISAYAQTEDAEEEEKDLLYNALTQSYDSALTY